MAQRWGVSKAWLKRELEQLGRDLFNINLQIQHIKQGQQQGNIATLEQEKGCSKGNRTSETEGKDKGRKAIGWYLFLGV